MAGRIVIDTFVTLDLVAQSPGGPEEDPSGGFPFGGWQAPLIDDVAGEQVQRGMESMDALLLGRRTYDIFAAYWPGRDDPIARLFARLPRYVATRGEPDLAWEGSQRVGDDLAADVAMLRERHAETHVIGSADLVESLLAERLFDELRLWVHPVVLGSGRKVLGDGAMPTALRLVAPPETSGTGVVLLRYAPVGDPTTGDMTVD